ncbi:MAG: calcium-binding protein [Paracoccaceae bacterium]
MQQRPGGAGACLLYGDDGDDVITAPNSHSQIYGGAGNDVLTLNLAQSQFGTGTARVDGGSESDVLILTLFATTTAQTLNLSTASVTLADGTLITGIEGIRLQSTAGADSIIASNDSRGALFSTIDGGFGNDTLMASANGASLNGGRGSDLLQGGAGNDVLTGGYGTDNDTLSGAGGNDTLDGGYGNDILNGGAGNDVMLGGAGSDTYMVDAIGDQVFETTTTTSTTDSGGIDTVQSWISLNLDATAGVRFVENLVLVGTANINAIGNALDNHLTGNDGSNVLNGGSGDDFIFGGITASDLRDVVYGGDGNDNIDGGAGNDELNGGNGNDTVIGGLGSDTVIGNDGNDVLGGSGGSDVMSGNAGNDVLNGGFGFDRMNGGTGADSFFHAGVADHGSDWIQDYNAAEGDVLTVGLAGATRAQFQVNYNTTPGAGQAGVGEAFVIYRPTGQPLWALVDGGDDTVINLQIGGQVYDLVA